MSVTQDSALLPQAGSSALIAAEPTAGSEPKCLALVKGVSDEWCKKNCWGIVRFCPESQCDCVEAPATIGNESDAPEALTAAEQPDLSLVPSPSPQPAAHLSKAKKATQATKATAKTTHGHYGAEKAEDELEETDCLGDGKSALVPVSANQTEATEEVDEFEVDEEAEPLRRKGNAHHTRSRLSKHRRGTATDAQAGRTGHSQSREDRERKKLHDLTDTLAERTEERRASKEIEERKKLTDLTAELCAEDPCQIGCPPNAACALVVNSGIDGEVSMVRKTPGEDAAAAAEASFAVTEEEVAAEQV